ncbi:MAG: hypothetical protein ACR2NR_16350 [Solirubrobacteraceae bacterium]
MILNVILCSAVVVAVVAPLVWAILTAHRDQPVAIAKVHSDRGVTRAPRPRRQQRAPQPGFGGAKPGQASPTQ